MRSKPHDDTRRIIDGTESGRTTGARHSLGVSPAMSTRLPRKHCFGRAALDIDIARLKEIPEDALVGLDGNQRIKILLYRQEPTPKAEPKPAPVNANPPMRITLRK